MADMTYEVLEHVHYETNSPRGTETFDFVPGTITPNEDERFVLEYELIPAGLARRTGEAPASPVIPADVPAPDVEAAP